jgi:predicted ferric reductase
MSSQPLPITKKRWDFSSNKTRLLTYLLIISIPFVATYALDMQEKTFYAAFISLFNTLAMMMFYIQFPLAGRLKRIALFANIDWGMSQHKKMGKWLGIIFLIHPILIIAPRFLVSFTDGMRSLIAIITAPQMLTGIIAWVGLMVWVLLAVFKNRLNIRYEVWRFIHMLGFVTIAILATMHITSVGSHGQFANWFNWLWWGLCTLSVGIVLYNYFVKPLILKSQPFKLVEVKQISSSDWQLTIDKPANSNFDFEPGQFVWLNTSASGGVKDHPFSIASSRSSLPSLSFVIRNLGDYTSKLQELKVSQNVYVDGPYGSLSLGDAKHSNAIILIAGGAGIGPMLSLIRGLADLEDPRPVRLIYGNNHFDQMVLQDEIHALEKNMPNFKQQLVCMESTAQKGVYQGVIDQTVISQVMGDSVIQDWAVFLCGPKPMIAAVKETLKTINVPNKNIHYEHLSF